MLPISRASFKAVVTRERGHLSLSKEDEGKRRRLILSRDRQFLYDALIE
jgi:hypothetical protein